MKHYSNAPGVTHVVNEYDNPRNKPQMGKGAPSTKKWTPQKEEPVAEGRGKTRRKRAAAILAKAKRGR